MRLALLGMALLLEAVLIRAWVAPRLREQGRSAAEAWRGLPYSPAVWMGLILITAAVSPVAAGVLAIAVVIGGVVQLAIGVRRFPAVWRLIGDPDAWRGERGE